MAIWQADFHSAEWEPLNHTEQRIWTRPVQQGHSGCSCETRVGETEGTELVAGGDGGLNQGSPDGDVGNRLIAAMW